VRTADLGGGQVNDDHVAAGRQRAKCLGEPPDGRLVKRSRRAQGRGKPPALPELRDARHHDAPEVATADPDVADGAETDDEDDDDELLVGVEAAELALLVDDVPDDVLCEADAAAGSATAMTTAAAALAAPAPAVAAASLVFPRRRDRWARARASSADSRSGVIGRSPVSW